MKQTNSTCVCKSVFKSEDQAERKQVFNQKWIAIINFLEKEKNK